MQLLQDTRDRRDRPQCHNGCTPARERSRLSRFPNSLLRRYCYSTSRANVPEFERDTRCLLDPSLAVSIEISLPDSNSSAFTGRFPRKRRWIGGRASVAAGSVESTLLVGSESGFMVELSYVRFACRTIIRPTRVSGLAETRIGRQVLAVYPLIGRPSFSHVVAEKQEASCGVFQTQSDARPTTAGRPSAVKSRPVTRPHWSAYPGPNCQRECIRATMPRQWPRTLCRVVATTPDRQRLPVL